MGRILKEYLHVPALENSELAQRETRQQLKCLHACNLQNQVTTLCIYKALGQKFSCTFVTQSGRPTVVMWSVYLLQKGTISGRATLP